MSHSTISGVRSGVPLFTIPDTPNHELAEGILLKDLDQMRRALDQGADPSGRNGSGYMLHLAISAEYLPAFALLLEYGADCTVTNHLRNLPIHSAAVRGLKNFVELLLVAGSPLDCENIWHVTPLGAAKIGKSVECADLIRAAFDRQIGR